MATWQNTSLIMLRTMLNDAGCGEFVEAENIKALSDKIIEYSNFNSNDDYQCSLYRCGKGW